MINPLLPRKDTSKNHLLLSRIEELLKTAGKALADDIENRLKQDVPAEPNAPPVFAIPRIHLSPREKVVLELIVQGKTNKEIAGEIYLSEGGVKNIITQLNSILGFENRVQLAVFAVLNSLVAGDALSMYYKQINRGNTNVQNKSCHCR